jgi:hypothetical protein
MLQKEPNINLKSALAVDDVVRVSSMYAAQLLPFNTDENSYEFFKYSTPSKIPNMILSRRPVVNTGILFTVDSNLQHEEIVEWTISERVARQYLYCFARIVG